MNKIKTLSDATVSQIAAGEIIENPASVCKELIENSIDAGAKNINIQLGDQLIDFIRVTDDGEGIAREDLPYAFMRHATSKLSKVADLDDILTLGFRGEALASIANISQIEVVTKTKDMEIGSKASLIQGKVDEILAIGAPQGTSILVKNLFYNTPVRKKYLKSIRKELEYILSTIETIALGHSDIAFLVYYKSKILLQSYPSSNRLNHLFSLLGREIAENLIPIQFDSQSYRIEGFVSNNNLHRSNPQKEYIFINGRSVRNKKISKSIRSIYHTLIPLQRYPVFILYLWLDPMLVDVNIHPQKQYVRLSNENYLIEILEKLIREKLLPNRVIPEFQVEKEKRADQAGQKEEIESQTIFDIASSLAKKEDQRRQEGESKLFSHQDGQVSREDNRLSMEDSSNYRASIKEESLLSNGEPHEYRGLSFDNILAFDVGEKREAWLDLDLEKIDYIGSLFKTYLLFEDKMSSSMLVVDQHAAHERILFERFYQELSKKKIDRQVLLSPIVLQLSTKEQMKLVDHIDEFKELGFQLELFGDTSLILREVPNSVLISDYKTFLFDSLVELEEGRGLVEQNIYKVMRMACRAAIKGGDRIDGLEARKLLAELSEARIPYSCPHGRPTMVRLSKNEIEKIFLREG